MDPEMEPVAADIEGEEEEDAPVIPGEDEDEDEEDLGKHGMHEEDEDGLPVE